MFDTTFHQTMPPEAYTYALPTDLCRQHGIRRYGGASAGTAAAAGTACTAWACSGAAWPAGSLAGSRCGPCEPEPAPSHGTGRASERVLPHCSPLLSTADTPTQASTASATRT